MLPPCPLNSCSSETNPLGAKIRCVCPGLLGEHVNLLRHLAQKKVADGGAVV